MYVCACMCVFCKRDWNAHIYSDLNGKIIKVGDNRSSAGS